MYIATMSIQNTGDVWVEFAYITGTATAYTNSTVSFNATIPIDVYQTIGTVVKKYVHVHVEHDYLIEGVTQNVYDDQYCYLFILK